MARSETLADGTPLLYRAPAQGAVDGNTVDMDLERNAFADNAIRYEAAVTFLQLADQGHADGHPGRTIIMSLFNIFNVSGSAMSAQAQRWSTVASNLANADSATSATGEAYRAKQVVFEAVPAGQRRHGRQGAEGDRGLRRR